MAILDTKDQLSVLVTGNRGFIGTNLFKRLGTNLRLVPVDESDKQRVNILERNQLLTKENIDVIIHLASKTSIVNSTMDPYETYLTNITGTLNVLDFARQNDIKKIVNFSTYVYGKPHYFPIDEKHPVNPHSPYTKSKVIAEKLCENYAQDYGIDIVTLRPFYVYGPSSNKTSFIPLIIKQILQNGKVILSNKNTRRDFLFIDDFVDFLYRVLLDYPKGYNLYNVGYGKSYTLEHVVDIIKETMGIEVEIEYNGSMRPDDIVDMVADIGAIQRLYAWQPKVDIKTGIRLTVEDIVNNSAHL